MNAPLTPTRAYCIVCNAGPEVIAKVNALKAQGATYRAIAKHFGDQFGTATIFRHITQCPTGLHAIAARHEEETRDEGLCVSLNDLLARIDQSFERLAEDALALRQEGDRRGAGALEAQLAKQLVSFYSGTIERQQRARETAAQEAATLALDAVSEEKQRPKGRALVDLILEARQRGTTVPAEDVERWEREQGASEPDAPATPPALAAPEDAEIVDDDDDVDPLS